MSDATLAETKPLPIPDPESQAFWDGVARGELLLLHCNNCGYVHYHQQLYCRRCSSPDLEHRAASGNGFIYSFSTVYRPAGPAFAAETPYTVVLVELEEGPRMISSLVGAAPDDVDFGKKVRFVPEKITDEISLPRFVLAD